MPPGILRPHLAPSGKGNCKFQLTKKERLRLKMGDSWPDKYFSLDALILV